MTCRNCRLRKINEMKTNPFSSSPSHIILSKPHNLFYTQIRKRKSLENVSYLKFVCVFYSNRWMGWVDGVCVCVWSFHVQSKFCCNPRSFCFIGTVLLKSCRQKQMRPYILFDKTLAVTEERELAGSSEICYDCSISLSDINSTRERRKMNV